MNLITRLLSGIRPSYQLEIDAEGEFQTGRELIKVLSRRYAPLTATMISLLSLTRSEYVIFSPQKMHLLFHELFDYTQYRHQTPTLFPMFLASLCPFLSPKRLACVALSYFLSSSFLFFSLALQL